ncbi:MAG: heme-binding protein [Comamonadaceae bacterium]|nr:heme-binding protein [Comamonadaceae bacterium]
MHRLPTFAALTLALSAVSTQTAQAADAPPLFTVQQLTPETALVAAQAALAHCRKAGHQVAVAVVDRGGLVQVLLRDRFAGAHTLDIAPRKAWTAASFRMPTAALASETQAGRPMSGIRQSAQVMAIGGGQVIEAAGAVVGAIGVSGAPGGEADDACALAGVRAVADAIELRD